MKQIRLLLGLTIVFAMIGFTSCSDDEDSTGGDGSTPDLSPSISFLGGAEYTSSDVTVGLGDTIKVGIQANANATSGEKLSNFRATRDNGAEVIIDSSFKESSFTLDLTIIADTTARSETFVFTITDKDSKTNQLTLVITTEDQSTNPLSSYSAKLLYAPVVDGTSSSVIDLETGTTYTINNGGTNSSLIDLGYYYGTNDGASLAAPSEYPTSIYDLGWATLNATQLKTTTTAFSSITTDVEVQSEWTNAGTAVGAVTNLSTNDVILFKTVNNKHGVIEVTNISGTYNQGDYLEMNIKVAN